MLVAEENEVKGLLGSYWLGHIEHLLVVENPSLWN